MSIDQPAAQAAAGDAAAPQALTQYIAQPGIPMAGSFAMAGGGFGAVGGLPAFSPVAGADATRGPVARAGEVIPGTGPVAGNVFLDAAAAPRAQADASVISNPQLARTALDTSTATTAKAGTDKVAELSTKPQLTFEADKSKANVLIDKNGDYSFNKDKPIKAGDEKASAYVDPTLKDTTKIAAAIDKANIELAKQGIQLQKPADMATALKTVQAEQAKATEKAKTDKNKTNPENGGGKKPIPDGGGGGGGGGGGCNVPDKKDRNRDNDKNGGNNKNHNSDSSSLPKSYEKSSQFVSDKGGMNKGSYANFVNSVYGNIPGFSGQGGLMSQFADIDNDPNMSPAEKAAAKAKAMAKFQDEHKDEITKNTQAYGKEIGDFGDKASAANFDSIAKNLSDSSKAGSIVNMLSQKENASSSDISSVFDTKAQKSLTNLALVESQGTDWKSKSKDKDEATKIAEAQAKATAAIIASPFTFTRK